MNNIIICSRIFLERSFMETTLADAMPNFEIISVDSPGKILSQLNSSLTKLLIIDVPHFDANYSSIITSAKKIAPQTPVLITAFGAEKEISVHMRRLEITDYLLKPYRPSWLVAAANSIVADHTVKEIKRVNKNSERYLGLIHEAMGRFEYKKCIDLAKEYLVLLHNQGDNNDVIRRNTVSFAEGIAMLGEELGYGEKWKKSSTLERFRNRLNLQCDMYESYLVCEKLLDMIFETLDQDKVYATSDEQRMISYIDRNIKKGISLDDAAEYVSMSSCYFSRFFKKTLGQNFITYVTNRKIEIAKYMLLETNMPVINVAYELSYGETNYFSKTFKQKVGLTPTEFREQGNSLVTAKVV